jgi:Spy/CpxP family protein refolding chaperone
MRRLVIVLGLIWGAGCTAAFAQSDTNDALIRERAREKKLFDLGAAPLSLSQGSPLQLYFQPKKGSLTDALQTGLQGTWWREQYWIKELSLTPDQQKKMDDAFRQNKIKLIDMTAALEKEELNLEPLVESINSGDETKILAGIDRIADARAGLEKANARMLLGIRQIMTQEQWDKLQTSKGKTLQYFPSVKAK